MVVKILLTSTTIVLNHFAEGANPDLRFC